jgi:transcriptional regulator with XRE-family HTH domain
MNIADELRDTKYKNVFILLKRKGISQNELAKSIGVSRGNISDWKSGRKNPTTDVLVKIADYFDVSVDFLLGRNASEFIEVPQKAVNSANVKKELAQKLGDIVMEADAFATEAVELYGATDKLSPMCTSLKAGIEQLIAALE